VNGQLRLSSKSVVIFRRQKLVSPTFRAALEHVPFSPPMPEYKQASDILSAGLGAGLSVSVFPEKR